MDESSRAEPHDEPTKSRALHTKEQNPSSPHARGSRSNPDQVLIVDDDPLVLTTLGAMLAGSGFNVVLASRKSDAIALLSKPHSAIGVVILDGIMPEGDGVETARAIRMIAPQLPVLGLSGAGPLMLEAMRAAGVSTVLQKPITTRTLVAEINALRALSRPALSVISGRLGARS